jgi:hypothetical protein
MCASCVCAGESVDGRAAGSTSFTSIHSLRRYSSKFCKSDWNKHRLDFHHNGPEKSMTTEALYGVTGRMASSLSNVCAKHQRVTE